MILDPTVRAWAEINLSALAHNIAQMRARFAHAPLMAVVKANAYGHGLDLTAAEASRQGIDRFGVATAEEGAQLRQLLPNAQIYILAPSLPEDADALIDYRLIPSISFLPLARELSRKAVARKIEAQAYLEIDTGIGRAGMLPEDALRWGAELAELNGIRWRGIFTHFASADEDMADAARQWESLQQLTPLLERISREGFSASNSPGALGLPETREGMVRPGLLLYGIEPRPGIFAEYQIQLQPVLSLKARVLLVRSLPEGSSISYGRTYTVPTGGGRYATVGTGYGDGYPRRLSNTGYVLLHGKPVPICGRVCMDQLVVDISSLPECREGDIATLIGGFGASALRAADLAEQIGATPHEITTCLSERVPRIPVRE